MFRFTFSPTAYSTYELPTTYIHENTKDAQVRWKDYHSKTRFALAANDPNSQLVARVLHSRENLESHAIQQAYRKACWDQTMDPKSPFLSRLSAATNFFFLQMGSIVTKQPSDHQLYDRYAKAREELFTAYAFSRKMLEDNPNPLTDPCACDLYTQSSYSNINICVTDSSSFYFFPTSREPSVLSHEFSNSFRSPLSRNHKVHFLSAIDEEPTKLNSNNFSMKPAHIHAHPHHTKRHHVLISENPVNPILDKFDTISLGSSPSHSPPPQQYAEHLDLKCSDISIASSKEPDKMDDWVKDLARGATALDTLSNAEKKAKNSMFYQKVAGGSIVVGGVVITAAALRALTRKSQ